MMDGGEHFQGPLDVVVRHEVEYRKDGSKKAALAGALVALMGFVIASMGAPNLGAGIIGLGFVMLRIYATKNRTADTKYITERMQVGVSASGIEVEGRDTGRFTVSRRSIAKAYQQPRADGRSTVRCVDESGTVRFEAEVTDAAEARHILSALGCDVTRDRLRYDLAPWMPNRLGQLATVLLAGSSVLVALSLAVSGHGWAAGALGVAVVVAQILLARALWGAVEVGTDGLLLTSSAGKHRFLRFDEVRDVVRKGSAVEVVVAHGKRVRLELSPTLHGGEVGRDAMALCARIEEAREVHRAQKDGGDNTLARRLSKGDRPAGQWLSELAAIRTMEGGYRAAGTADGDLWRVVEDAGAPEEARAAAALMLRGSDEAAPRLRVAAQAVASPRLRIALETAANPSAEETDVGQALAAFDETRQKAG